MSKPSTTTKRRKVTLSDLADQLGLDKSSVSLALRGSPKISKAARARVVAAAQQLGYRPNLAARQLATKSPQVVALILSSSFAPLVFGGTATTIQALAQQATAAELLFSIFPSDDFVKGLQGDLPLPLQPDGVLVWGDVPAHLATVIQTLVDSVVVVDPNAMSYADYPGMSVTVDNAGGSRLVTEHLIAQSAKHLLFVMGDREHLGHHQRWSGTREAWLRRNALDTLLFCYKEELTDQLLAGFVEQPGTAIFCSNDMCALEVWRHLQKLRIHVPEQVLLAGFDAELSSNMLGLTSAAYDAGELGRAAFQALLRQLKGDEPSEKHIVIPADIRIGHTTQRTVV
jgi:DNA-binding LacI/PurR family transcriptional regulator